MDVVKILKTLISYDTSNPPGNEKYVSEWISEFFTKQGFETKTISVSDKRSSVVVSKKYTSTGPKLVFNGHLDVVPTVESWSTDPFEATIKEEKVFGRGAADMKGGVAAMMIAAVMNLNNEELCGELELHFVADEELTNLGTRSLINEWINADYVVIGEPTNLEINIAHRGTARFEVSFLGKSCHSSLPHLGDNAITKAAKAIIVIDNHNLDLLKIKHDILPAPSIAVAFIEGGIKDNIIPDFCKIKIDRRILPKETVDQIGKEIELILAEANLFIGKDYELKNYIFLSAGEENPESELVQKAQEAYSKVFQKEPELKDFRATCEQAIFAEKNVSTIIFGPGSLDQAHVANEFVEIQQLKKAVEYYSELINMLLSKARNYKNSPKQ